MSIYSVDKLMQETRRLAAEYHRLTGQVLPVSNEISKHDVVKILKFLPPKEQESGVDLLGCGPWNGAKVQVKSRVIFDNAKSRQRIGQINVDGKWDKIVLVLMNADYEPIEIYIANRETILPEGADSTILNKKKPKGILSVARFKAISELAWSKDFNNKCS